MCGLFGMISSFLNKEDHAIFSDLGVMSAPRGIDSTGVMSIFWDNNDPNAEPVRIIKAVEDPITFFIKKKERMDAFSKPHQIRALCGHVRSRSVGAINLDNAHPFNFKNVAGMHNGSIWSHFGNRENYGTDSEAIMELLNDLPFTEVLKEINVGAAPAFALVWFDRRTMSLHFYRNDTRSFWFGKSNSTLLYASEAYVLRAAAVRRGKDVQDKTWVSLEPQVLVTIPLNTWTPLQSIKTEKIPLPPLRTAFVFKNSRVGVINENFPWKEGTSTVYPIGVEDEEVCDVGMSDAADPNALVTSFRSTREAGQTERKTIALPPPEPIKETKDGKNVLSLPAFNKKKTKKTAEDGTEDDEKKIIKGFNGELITESQFYKRSRSGCTCCSSVLEPDDDIAWFAVDEPMCEECVNLDWVREYYGLEDDDITHLLRKGQ